MLVVPLQRQVLAELARVEEPAVPPAQQEQQAREEALEQREVVEQSPRAEVAHPLQILSVTQGLFQTAQGFLPPLILSSQEVGVAREALPIASVSIGPTETPIFPSFLLLWDPAAPAMRYSLV